MRPAIISALSFFLFIGYVQTISAGCLVSQNNGNGQIGGSDNIDLGQSFSASCDGVVDSVTVYTLNSLGDNGIPETTIRIYSGSSGTAGSLIYTSQLFSASPNTVPLNQLNAHRYEFSDGPTVTASSSYSVVFDTGAPPAGTWSAFYADNNPYTEGSVIVSGADTTTYPNGDLRFMIGISYSPGDVDNDNAVELDDIILALQIVTGTPITGTISTDADVNNDGYIGLPEAIYILGQLSGS